MIHKLHISEMAKKMFRHERGLKDPRIMHPQREWLIGLMVMVALFLVCAGWSAKVFFENRSISIGQPTQGQVHDTVYRQTQVEEALNLMRTRESKLQSLLGTTPVAPEPEVVIEPATTTEPVIEETAEDEGAAIESPEETLPQIAI